MNKMCKAISKDSGNWVTGYYCPCIFDNHYSEPAIVVIHGSSWTPIKVFQKTVCKCTEMQDMNGTIAYEHDIIKHNFGDEIGVIRYGEYCNPFNDAHAIHIGFYIDWVSGRDKDLLRKDLGYWLKTSVIAGNGFDKVNNNTESSME